MLIVIRLYMNMYEILNSKTVKISLQRRENNSW